MLLHLLLSCQAKSPISAHEQVIENERKELVGAAEVKRTENLSVVNLR